MNVFGPRSKRHASAGCGAELKIRTGTASFRSRSLDLRVPNRHRRGTFERIGIPSSLSPDAHRDSYCTSATSKRAFVLELITFTRARKEKMCVTVFVVVEVDAVRHRRLFDAFVEKYQGDLASCDG